MCGGGQRIALWSQLSPPVCPWFTAVRLRSSGLRVEFYPQRSQVLAYIYLLTASFVTPSDLLQSFMIVRLPAGTSSDGICLSRGLHSLKRVQSGPWSCTSNTDWPGKTADIKHFLRVLLLSQSLSPAFLWPWLFGHHSAFPCRKWESGFLGGVFYLFYDRSPIEWSAGFFFCCCLFCSINSVNIGSKILS